MISVADLLAAPLRHSWAAPSKRATPEGAASETALDLAREIAARIPPSVEGHGGDAALFHAANELATVLGEDAAAIESVLVEVFSPRCLPPWDAAKLRYEAERAAERQATPEARYARRRDAREAPLALSSAAVSIDDDAFVDWTAPAPPIDWYIRDLAIAPSEGKITVIGGDPGAGKGPLADYLALHLALGLPLFGRLPVRRARTAILDFEGAALTRKRIESHARGVGVDPRDLAGELYLRRCDASEMLDPDLPWVRALVEEREIEALVVDSYMSAAAGTDVDPNSQAFAWLAQALGRLGIVVIVVAHARKPAKAARGERPALGDLAGSFALGGMAQTGIGVWVPDEEDRTLSRIGCMRAPDEPFRSLDIRWRRSGSDAAPTWAATLEGVEREVDRRRTEAERLTQIARRLVSHVWTTGPSMPWAPNQLAAATGVHHRDVSRVLGALEAARLAHAADTRGSRRYALAPAQRMPLVTIEVGNDGGATAHFDAASPRRKWRA